MSYPEALSRTTLDYNLATLDIREDSLADVHTDYLSYTCKDKYDMIITNPPFNIAQQVITKAFNDVKDNGFVCMLLRLNYYGSRDRFNFWKHNMSKYTIVHHKRMSFTEDRKTDSIEYMHCVWQKGNKQNNSRLYLI